MTAPVFEMQPSVPSEPPPAAPISRFSLADLFHWLRLMWPAILVIVAGFFFFAEAIVATIVSTPHPALVYAIFGVCVVAIAAAMLALHRYLYEAKLAAQWLVWSDQARAAALASGAATSVFAPVYRLLAGQTRLSPEARQAAVTAELDAATYSLETRLEFPNFLGGALVGLGLVGTFVGLLGTLEDLSKVFSALVNSGSSTMSPTQMFADMVSKLQAPMRGMGTAFVASLYGLLGSLIVTLMLVSARKTGSATAKQVQSVVRQLGYGAQLADVDAAAMPVKSPGSTPMQEPEAVAERHQEILHSLKSLQWSIDQTRTRLDANAKLQETATAQSSQALQHMSAAVMSLADSQRKVDETLASQLQAFRDILVNDRENLLQLLRSTRQDSVETVKALHACRMSFDQSARSLRATLAYLDPMAASDSPHHTP